MYCTLRKWLFGTLAVAGLAGSLYLISEHTGHPVHGQQGMVQCLWDLIVNNPIAAAVTLDAVIAGMAFLIWMMPEASRLSMRHWWLYVVLLFTSPLAFVVPFFLFMREIRIDRLARERNTQDAPF